jgi:YggT family protein
MTTTTVKTDPPAPAPTHSVTSVNVAAAPAGRSSIWTASRVIALVFSVVEVLLLVRFTLKLFGANAEQAFVSAIYAITEALVAPFRGIFAQPGGSPIFEIATVLSIVFFMLVAALIVAIVRAVTGRREERDGTTEVTTS